MQIEDLRLGFVSARSAYAEGEKVWVDAGVGRLVDVWAPECRQFTLTMSLAPRRMPYHDHLLSISRSQFLPMPWLPSVARGFHKAAACRRVIRQTEAQSDVLLVQLPFAAPLALLGPRTPRVYHLCADIWNVARTSPLYRGVKRLPALAFGAAIDLLQRRLLHGPHARAVTNGATLREHFGFPAGRSVVSATIMEKEILCARRQRPTDAPFRILYVGFIREEKGVDVLLDAYEQLLAEIPQAELVIVGGRSMVDHGMSQRLDRRAAELNRTGAVMLLGQLEFGPELFQCFADADVLAVPSRAEGTPRVLIEARAFACPVVATAVGGIPSSIADEVDGLLIPPDNPSALRQAILRIARDPLLKQRLIKAGLERVRQSTVEVYAQAIAQEVVLAFKASQPPLIPAVALVADEATPIELGR